MRNLASVFVILLTGMFARAQFFTMSVTDYGFFGPGQLFDDQTARDAIDTAVSELQSQVNSSFPDIDQTRFIRGMANSNAIAAKGAVDTPLADFELFTAGFSAGAAIDLGNASLSSASGALRPEDFGGVGGFMGMSIGVPGSILGLSSLIPKSMVLFHFNSINQNFNLSTASTMEFKNSNFGVRVAFPLIEGTQGLARWSGVRASTGIEYSTAKLVVRQSINTTIPGNTLAVGVDNFTFDAVFTQSASFGAELTTYSIPVEVATGGELLNVFGAFLGLGLDLNFGSAKSIVSGGGPITFDVSGAQSTTITAVGNLDAGASGGPRFENLRMFLGMNLDAYLIDLYFQYNRMLLDPIYSLSGGIRFVW